MVHQLFGGFCGFCFFVLLACVVFVVCFFFVLGGSVFFVFVWLVVGFCLLCYPFFFTLDGGGLGMGVSDFVCLFVLVR